MRSDNAANTGVVSATQLSPKLSLIAGPWSGTEVHFNVGRGFHGNDARGTVTRVDQAFNLTNRKASAIDYYYASRLPGEAAAVDDVHFHPIESRSLRVNLIAAF